MLFDLPSEAQFCGLFAERGSKCSLNAHQIYHPPPPPPPPPPLPLTSLATALVN